MGMQDSCEPCRSPEFFIVLGKGFQNILNCRKHQRVKRSLILPDKFSELVRKSEGDQVVCAWQQLVELFFNPLLAFMVLAMRTVSVAAEQYILAQFSCYAL